MRYVPNIVVDWYERSPLWARSLSSTVYGALKNRREITAEFGKCFAELSESQWWTLPRLRELQADRLRRLIIHAAANVPYYGKTFAEYGINPSQVQTPDDLRTLPSVSKEVVRNRWKELIARGYDVRRLRSESTSGTTGKPLTAWMDEKTYAYSKAVQWLQHSWAGYTHKEWIGILAGYKVVPVARAKAPFWTTNYAGRQVHFSTYHLNPKYLKEYVEKLESRGIQFLLGYPFAIGLLAQHMLSTKKTYPLRGVFVSSEPMLDWEQRAMEKAFQCPIYNYFGQAERVVFGVSCESSGNLHIAMETGIAEVRENSTAGNTEGELLATSLVNYAMPLIRYELGDEISILNEPCPCGRQHMRIGPIKSRFGKGDVVFTPQGSLVSAPALTIPFKDIRGIVASQIIQESVDSLLVSIVADQGYDRTQEEQLRRNIQSMVGPDMKIQFQYVDEVRRTATSKFKFFISELP